MVLHVLHGVWIVQLGCVADFLLGVDVVIVEFVLVVPLSSICASHA
jgi:hypothetical protein